MYFRLKRNDGEYRYIKEKGIPHFDSSNTFTGYFGYCIDITEDKNTQELLTKEQERLSGIIDGANFGTWEWNVQTGKTTINSRWAEILGYTIQELNPISQDTWFDLCHPKDREKSDKAFEAHCAGTKDFYECEFRMRHKNGDWIWILDRGRVVTWTEDGKPINAMGIHQDITERKKAEVKLLNSEAKYRELVENTTDVLYSISISGDFLYVSNAWKRQLGHERHEVIGKSYTEFLHPDDFEHCATRLKEIFLTEEIITDLEYRIRHKDGTWRWHSSSGSFKKDETGWVILFDGISHDITQKKKDEEQITRQNLTQKVLIELASSFINVPLDEIDDAINKALETTGKHFDVDRSYIFDYDWKNGICTNTYEWCAEGITPEIENLKEVPIEALPQWASTHKKGEKMVIANINELDDDQSGLKDILEPQGIKSLMTLPLMLDEYCTGFVGFDSVKNYRTYSQSEENLLILFSEMLVNISKRQIAGEQLFKEKLKVEQHAEELREAQKVAKLGSWNLDLIKEQVTWSEELYNIYGFDSDFPPPPWTEQEKIFGQESWKKLNDIISTSIEKKSPYELELSFNRPDKSTGWIWKKGEPWLDHDGVLIGFRGVAQDITERKELEIELNKSRDLHESTAKRLQVASTSAGLGIFEWDILNDNLHWDDRMFKLYGFKKENVELNFDLWSNSVHPDDLERALEDVNNSLNGTIFDSLFRIVHTNGNELYIKGYGDVIRDKKGVPIKMIGVNMDITESQIHQRSLEFKNKQLVDFSNILAHNLRAPLVNIGMLVDLIDENEDPEETKEFTGQLKSVLDHLNEVFNELMESIQIRQDLDIKSTKIDLSERINKVLKSLNGQITQFKAEINIDISEAPTIRYPLKYIDSILSNLLSNCLKYRSPKRNPIVTVKTIKNNRDVILSITDNGLGLDMKVAKKNLFKIRKVFHDHPDAKGFGLFLIKTQIDAMEGEIWVESEPDKGSTFFVKFKNAII